MQRTATWTRVGTDVTGQTSVADILREASLDYTVVKEPIYLQGGVQIPDRVATLKAETRTPIGIVSPKYEIYQNADAFSFLEEIPGIEFVRAGESRNGTVYIIGKLPEVKVMDDAFNPYVIFQNGHTGWISLKATICPLRIVCQNQFAMSFGKMANTISIHHSSQLASRLMEAQSLLTDVATYMNGFTNTAEELALLKITEADRYKICDAFFESAKAITDRQKDTVALKIAQFNNCYNAEDNANFKGTAWGLMNALTDYETHKERKQTEASIDSAFMSVTFDTSLLSRMMNIVKQTVVA